MKSPLRSAFLTGSYLLPLVRDGIQSLSADHARDYLHAQVRTAFADSLNLDDAMRQHHPQDHRWDYLLGHTTTREVVALEPHTASTHEISTLISKRSAALVQLRGHLRDGVVISKWFWVASGRVDFTSIDKADLQLTQSGITFVGKRLLKKHLSTDHTRAGRLREPPAHRRSAARRR
jgi:hypothetical protein